MCRLTLSLNGDVGQGVLIWGLYNFDDTRVSTPSAHRPEKPTWLQSRPSVQLDTFGNRDQSKPSPAQTDRGIEHFVTRVEQGHG